MNQYHQTCSQPCHNQNVAVLIKTALDCATGLDELKGSVRTMYPMPVRLDDHEFDRITDVVERTYDACEQLGTKLGECHAAPIIRPDILTNSGLYFNLLEPEKNEYRIKDIAHALSHICRFTGHTREFYSVAQHCVLASREMERCTKAWEQSGEPALHPSKLAMAALLHDAAEAYLGDVATPLKQLLPAYKEIERSVEAALFAAFGLPLPMPYAVKQIDLALLATEQRDLMPPHDDEWTILQGIEPMPEIINPWGPEKACREFLNRWKELGGEL